jgi:MerR family transcriptional regulator, mercuric resistance operon regulatory protein
MCAVPIRRLSQDTATPVATIRYYESIGLLPKIDRGPGNQRQFSHRDAEILRFIRSRRDLGFSIPEIRQLLAAAGPGQVACDAAMHSARLQLQAVQDRMAELAQIHAELTAQVQTCAEACTPSRAAGCALIPPDPLPRLAGAR